MKTNKLTEFKGGWFVGDFDPSVLRTPDFEVGFLVHKAGETWPKHYHTGLEINYLVRGKMKMHNTIIEAGTIFCLFPYEVADPVFLEDCEVVVIKTPSKPGDKFIVSGDEV